MSRFVDYSQFYVLPHSKLPAAWKMSERALIEGLIADKFALK